MTKRKRKTENQLDQLIQNSKKRWTRDDKLTLLTALKNYGHTDIHKISAMLPQKTPGAITCMINKFISIARIANESQKSSINEWIKKMYEEVDYVVPLALYLIHRFEQHPDALNSGQCDYSVIYSLLYHLASSQVPPDLQLESKHALFQALSKIIRKAWLESSDKAAGYLTKEWKKRHIALQAYPGKKKSLS